MHLRDAFFFFSPLTKYPLYVRRRRLHRRRQPRGVEPNGRGRTTGAIDAADKWYGQSTPRGGGTRHARCAAIAGPRHGSARVAPPPTTTAARRRRSGSRSAAVPNRPASVVRVSHGFAFVCFVVLSVRPSSPSSGDRPSFPAGSFVNSRTPSASATHRTRRHDHDARPKHAACVVVDANTLRFPSKNSSRPFDSGDTIIILYKSGTVNHKPRAADMAFFFCGNVAFEFFHLLSRTTRFPVTRT